MRRILIVLLLMIPLCVYAGGNTETPEEEDDAQLKIVVSVLPQTYLVESIGGDRVSVEVMVPPGKNPSTYEPTPKQVLNIGDADAFITIGVAFEHAFMPVIKKNLPDLRIIPGDTGILKRTIEDHDHEESEHAEALDPHIWLDPLLMKIQARTIVDVLISLDNEGREAYEARYNETIEELDALHQMILEATSDLRGTTLFAYHPAFGYFADRYGMEQVAIETGGKEPTPAQLERVIEQAYDEAVRVILVQPEFPIASAEVVARAIGGSVIPVSTLRSDYIESMTELAQAIKEGGQYE